MTTKAIRNKPQPPPFAWWLAPLQDWQEGRLEMQNIVTDKRTVIHFDGGPKRRKGRQEPEPVARHWSDDL
jgi:hypothetical protein